MDNVCNCVHLLMAGFSLRSNCFAFKKSYFFFIPDTMDYRFSHHCGENVDLSKEKFKASWTHRFSDGVAFSCQPIQNYTRLKLDLAGTGHAYVGTISRDPETIKCMRNTLSHDVNVLKEMKVHKRLCAVDIKTLNKDGRQHVSFNFPGEEKHKEADEDIWLFLYIKFGDLVAVIRKFKMLIFGKSFRICAIFFNNKCLSRPPKHPLDSLLQF